ncbi:MAG: peptidylprolyl isomerase [Proteobacteria bacterium]|nr:peptidylprolyl isomerase [Pseudomonadota bacterium]
MKRIICALALTLVAMFGLPGCHGDQEENGIVARVNGRPITLEQLQLKYDFKKLSFAAETVGVVALKKDYGGILTDLIVQELVTQELETLGFSVTDDEVAAAESVIRADYPEGAFEEVLVEEYLDLQYWRQELRNRLAMEKFFNEVLRPDITIGYEEAEAYYKTHIQEFYLPLRLRFQLVSGPSREAVQNALNLYRKGESLESLQGRFDRLVIREIRLREDRLTVNWKNALKGLGVGEASSVISGENGFEALVFSERIPAKVLDPSQAYPVVERVLLDQKLRESFDSWLQEALAVAVIKVSPHLPLKLMTEESATEEAPAEVEIPSADELESQDEVPPDVMPESPEGAIPLDEIPESKS